MIRTAVIGSPLRQVRRSITRQAAPCSISEIRRDGFVGIAGGDAVLGLGPGHMADQPGVRRRNRKILLERVRHRLQVDQPILDRERLAFGFVPAAQRQYRRARPPTPRRALSCAEAARLRSSSRR